MDYDYKAPDRNIAKTYWRRLKDIDKAMADLRTTASQRVALDFLAYYFGCEKLAAAMVGMCEGLEGEAAENEYRYRKPNLDQIKAAAKALRIPFPENDLAYLFANDDDQKLLDTRVSARGLRNKVVHEFGPSNINNLVKHPTIISRMEKFLACSNHVLDYARDKPTE